MRVVVRQGFYCSGQINDKTLGQQFHGDENFVSLVPVNNFRSQNC